MGITSLRFFPSRLVAFQHRDFRLFWLGMLVATTGAQMQVIAVNWHVYDLLKETSASFTLFGRSISLSAGALGLGGLGLARVLPIILFALLGGMLADTTNRRRLLVSTLCAAAAIAGLLAFLSLSGQVSVLAIYLLAAAASAMLALQQPARESLVPNLVPRQHLMNAVSLNTLLMMIGTIAGPIIAGFVVEWSQIGLVYVLVAVAYIPAVIALSMMHYSGQMVTKNGGLGWQALVEGFRFTYSTRMIWNTMLLDFFATLLASTRTLLPIVANEILGVGAAGYGILATAQPVGAVLAGTIISLRREIYRQGAIFLVCVAVYGAATAIFGISTLFALSYLLFGLTGAADTTSSVIRGTIRQVLTPDHLRGRMVGVNMMFFMGGPQLGEVRAGLVAAAFGISFAIFTGGMMTLLLALWAAWRVPRLRRYTSETTQG